MKNQGRIFAVTSIIAIVLCALIYQSCTKDYLDFTKYDEALLLQGEYAMPVVYGKYTALDLLNKFDKKNKVNEYTTGNPNDFLNVLYLVFTEEVVSRTASELVTMPQLGAQKIMMDNIVSGWPIIGGYYQIEKDTMQNMWFGKPRIIDSIVLDGGQLSITCRSTFKRDGSIYLEFPYIRNKLGQTLTFNFNDIDASGTYVSTRTQNLAGYSIRLIHTPSDPDSNYLMTRYSIRVNASGTPFTPGEKIEFETSFQNLDFASMFGYFGQDSLLAQDSIKLNINLLSGTEDFYFADPRLTAIIKNSLGIPIRLTLKDLVATSSEPGKEFTQIIAFTSGGIFDLTYPKWKQNLPMYWPTVISPPLYDEVGKLIVSDTILKNENMTGFIESINKDPDFIRYTAEGVSNHLGNKNDRHQFVTDTGKFSVEVGVELPMYGYTNRYELNDTQKFNVFKDLEGEESEIEKLLIRFTTKNHLPAGIKAQLTFTDSTYKKISTVFKDYTAITEPAPVDPATKMVISARSSVADALIEAITLDKYQNVQYVIIEMIISSTNADNKENIKIRSTDYVEIKVGVDIKYKIKRSNTREISEF